MWNDKEKPPILEYIGWVVLISALCQGVYFFLEPYSILFQEKGTITVGYIIYAIVGTLFDTPNPMIATYIVLKRHKKISSVKEFCGLIFRSEHIGRAIVVTGLFCGAALGIGVLVGIRTNNPWYLMFPVFPILILGGGVEEVGWRGFLQPSMEKRFSYPIATLLTAAIWCVWHFPLWLLPSSNHYGDNIIGFSINIVVWAFAAAAIYKVTKSVFACVIYHAFMNTLGVVFNWNVLFDSFPGGLAINVYRVVLLIGSIVLWIAADRREKSRDSIRKKVVLHDRIKSTIV